MPLVRDSSIMITIDLEDWFQVENFKKIIPFSEWNQKEWRFEQQTEILLDLFDWYGVKVTFFVLAWNAEKVPGLIRKIEGRGHEIASHGFSHDLCVGRSGVELADDLKHSKDILEQIIGRKIYGYRAPSFSIDDRTIFQLKKTKYEYDSSYNSFGLNHRYGRLAVSSWSKYGIAYRDKDSFFELPISNIQLANLVLPWGGGGYFRLYPKVVFLFGVKWLLRKKRGYVFYLHPWEIDFTQPLMRKVGWLFSFRHYYKQKACLPNLMALIQCFNSCSFLTCSEYLQNVYYGNKNI